MTPGSDFLRFNVVGLIGVGVQLAALAVLTHGLGVHYLVATALALAVTLVHNFAWHVRWTWPVPAERLKSRLPWRLRAFAGFVGANGVVSLTGNLALMPLLVAGAGLGPVPANVVAIAVCGLVNYWLARRVLNAKPGLVLYPR